MLLSPAMLLTLRDQPNPACDDDINEENLNDYGPIRHRRGQVLAKHFWNEWSTNYLLSLARLHKWKIKQ